AAHLAGGCAACERAVVDYQEALARAAADVREAPPARVRHALLQRAGAPPARRSRLGLGLAWAASVVLAAGLGALASAKWDRVRYELLVKEVVVLRNRLATQVDMVSELRRVLDEHDKTLTLVKAQAA